MFSVVIPLFNKEQSIRNTVQSALAQTFVDFELIVVNDGSTDNSVEVVKEFDDPRIRIIDKLNGGVSSARNVGVANANFPWIAFLDADDIWEPFHLITLSLQIRRFPRDKVFCTSFRRSGEKLRTKRNDSIEIVDDYFKEAMQRLFFWTSVTCIHRTVFTEVGGFLEGISRGEDLELWSRIARRYRFIRSNLVTATYNMEAENKLMHAKYDFRRSSLYSVHERIQYFISKSEREYYLKALLGKFKYFLKTLDFCNAIKAIYRLLRLVFKPIKDERAEIQLDG